MLILMARNVLKLESFVSPLSPPLCLYDSLFYHTLTVSNGVRHLAGIMCMSLSYPDVSIVDG